MICSECKQEFEDRRSEMTPYRWAYSGGFRKGDVLVCSEICAGIHIKIKGYIGRALWLYEAQDGTLYPRYATNDPITYGYDDNKGQVSGICPKCGQKYGLSGRIEEIRRQLKTSDNYDLTLSYVTCSNCGTKLTLNSAQRRGKVQQTL